MEWDVRFDAAFATEAKEFPRAAQLEIAALAGLLQRFGPQLRRPHCDTLNGSKHANMKELRPGSTGRTEVRVLFAFDKARSAIMLVGGDKSAHWKSWYEINIPIADDRLDAHQHSLEDKVSEAPGTSRGAKQRKGQKRR